MIKNLLSAIRSIAKKMEERRRISFNEKLAAFNDDSAKQIEWAPATRGGVGFRTRTMDDSGNQTITFRPSLIALAISIGSMAMGFWLISQFVTPGISARHYVYDLFGAIRSMVYQLLNQTSIAKISVTLFGLVFVTIGLVSLYKLLRPVKFDSFSRSFAKGYPVFRRSLVSFDDIQAIQILSEHCRGTKNNSFTSYELNLVLKNKSRVTVVDHSDVSEIRKGGVALSKMLSVPVWDITKN